MSSKLLVASHLSSCVRLCVAAWVDTDVTQLDSTRQRSSSLSKPKYSDKFEKKKRVIFHRSHSQGKNLKSATREQTQSAKFEVLKNRTKLARNPGFFAVLTREIDWVFFDQNQR